VLGQEIGHGSGELLRSKGLFEESSAHKLFFTKPGGRKRGGEEDGEGGALGAEFLGERIAAHAAHDDVGDEQVDVALLSGEGEGLVAVLGRKGQIAGIAQNPNHQFTYGSLVVDDQNGTRTPIDSIHDLGSSGKGKGTGRSKIVQFPLRGFISDWQDSAPACRGPWTRDISRPLTTNGMCSMGHSFLILAGIMQVPNPQQQPLPPSPVQRIVVSPSPAVMISQDTLRLTAQALDASGRVVPGVVFRYLPSSGARFEGRVTEDGLVQSGATGTLPITVSATLPGVAPVLERVEVVMRPAAAGRIELVKVPTKVVVGQEVPLAARVYSIHGEPRADGIAWRAASTNVTIGEGKLTAVRPGRATVTGSVGQAVATFAVDVVPNDIRMLRLTLTAATGRTGDVIRTVVAQLPRQLHLLAVLNRRGPGDR